MNVVNKKAGKNMSDVQEINRSLVLKTIQQRGRCSRIEIARQVGLRQTTVTNIVNDLLASGVVVETSLIRGSQGRRAIGLSFNLEKYRIISVRLTRRHILAGLFDLAGTQHAQNRSEIDPEDGALAAMDAIRKSVSAMIAQAGTANVLGLGVGIPGPYLRDFGFISVMADFPGWDSVPLRDELSRAFPFPVYVEYDAHVGALAEWFHGRYYENNAVLLSVLMEQGLGAGLIQNGEVFPGSQGIAGNIGHMSIDYKGIPCECGNVGCLRNYCTANAVLRNITNILENTEESSILRDVQALSLHDVIFAANSGDALARNALKRAARYLAYGLVNTIYAYNPDVIILSQEFSGAGDLYLSEIKAVFRERLRPAIANKLTVQFTEVKGDVVLIGANMLVINHILQSPTKHFKIS